MKKRTWTIGVAGAVLTVTTLMSGVGLNNVASAAAKKPYTIEFIPGLTTDPFYLSMERGVKYEAQKLGMKVIVQGASQWSYQLQTPIVRSVAVSKPDFLLIAPNDINAMVAPLKQVHNAGIPIITVDTTISDTSILVSRITSNNYQGGQAAADTMAKMIGYSGDVAVIGTMPGISTTDQRQKGFLDQMKKKYPKIHVVSVQYSNDNQTTAAVETKDILLTHPQLKGVFGLNTYSAVGAANAFAAKKEKGVLISYDAEPQEIQYVRQGVIQALVVQKPYAEGVLAVQYAYDYLTGKKKAIKPSVVIPNIVATKANLNVPSVKKWFYTSN